MIAAGLARSRRAERVPAVSAEAAPFDFARYYDDPIGFARDVLGVDPWDDGTDDCQAGILRNVAAGDRVAVRSGHKTGKTGAIGLLAPWFYCTRPAGSRVILTAPTDRQVSEAGWREVKIRIRHARVPIPGKLNESARAGLRGFGGSQVIGFATLNADSFSGPSGAEMLIILDESAGIASELYEAIEGAATGGARILQLGNPTQITGPLFDAFHRVRGEWRLIHLDSERVVEWQERNGRIKGLATREAIERMRRIWGADDPRYQVRVKGEFPTSGADNVFGLARIMLAAEKHATVTAATVNHVRRLFRTEIGLDVARFGDDKSCAVARHGWYAHPSRKWSGLDSHGLAREAVAYALEAQCGRPSANPDRWLEKPLIRVDSIGVGAGVFDVIARDYRDKVDVQAVNASARAVNSDEYVNTRAEAHFVLRAWLDTGAIEDAEGMREDLRAPRFKMARDGRIQVEAKDEIKARIGRSPDEGDALALAVYDSQGAAGESIRAHNL